MLTGDKYVYRWATRVKALKDALAVYVLGTRWAPWEPISGDGWLNWAFVHYDRLRRRRQRRAALRCWWQALWVKLLRGE